MLTFLGILAIIGIVGILIKVTWPIIQFLLIILGIGVFMGMAFMLLIT